MDYHNNMIVFRDYRNNVIIVYTDYDNTVLILLTHNVVLSTNHHNIQVVHNNVIGCKDYLNNVIVLGDHHNIFVCSYGSH